MSKNQLKLSNYVFLTLPSFYKQGYNIAEITFSKTMQSFSICSEAAIQKCSREKVFWKYVAYSQKNTHAKVQFQ